MFPKNSLPFAPVSGFVAFDGGGHATSIDSPALRPATLAASVAQAGPEAEASGLHQSATWQPASSLRVRVVEGAVILALCAYFATAAVGLLH